MDIEQFMDNIPIYVINLKDSIDRKNHILEEFKNYNNIEFIEAVDGRNEQNFNNNYKIIYKSKHVDFTTAAIAVLCSHAKAIHSAYHEGLEKVCIFEDDVHIDLIKTTNFTMKNICNLNNDWEIIQLFYTNRIDEHYSNYLNFGLKLIRQNCDYFGSCYVINRKGMEKFLTNVIFTNGSDTFNIIPEIINLENTIFGFVKSYVVNRIVFYYWFDTVTYENYIYNDINHLRIIWQDIGMNVRKK